MDTGPGNRIHLGAGQYAPQPALKLKNMENKKKILIVEDDSDMRNVLSDHLSRSYEIVQAEDGEQGYNFILNFKPDLVLLDLMLPKLPGLELLERLRKNPDQALANTKVVIFSNFAEPELMLKAKSLNANEYLVKSNTDLDELAKKIEKIIGEVPGKAIF